MKKIILTITIVASIVILSSCKKCDMKQCESCMNSALYQEEKDVKSVEESYLNGNINYSEYVSKLKQAEIKCKNAISSCKTHSNCYEQ